MPNVSQNGAPKRPSAPFLCSFFANVTSQNTTVFIDVNAPNPNLGRDQKSKKNAKNVFRKRTRCRSTKKKDSDRLFDQKLPKRSQNGVRKVLMEVPFLALKMSLQKNASKIAPKLIFGLHLGPIWDHFGDIFVFFGQKMRKQRPASEAVTHRLLIFLYLVSPKCQYVH